MNVLQLLRNLSSEIQLLTTYTTLHLHTETLGSTYRPRELEGDDDLPGVIVPVLSGFLSALELKSIPTDNLSSFRAVGARPASRDLRLVFL